jgi:hypothetical protein
MIVTEATDYGNRKVVRILLNDADPQWFHGQEPAPAGHTGDTEDPDTTKQVCKECRNNWNIFETQFEGDALLKLVEISPAIGAVEQTNDTAAIMAQPAVFEVQAKTNEEIIEEALNRAQASIPPTPTIMVVG